MGFWQGLLYMAFQKKAYFSTTDTSLGDHKVDEWFEKYPQFIVAWLNKHTRK